MKRVPGLVVLLAVIALAACGSSIKVLASDPITGVCQSPTVTNLDTLDGAIDQANGNPEGTWDTSDIPALTSNQQQRLSAAAAVLRGDEPELISWDHNRLAAAFSAEAELFTGASDAPGGYTSNDVAVSTDQQTRIIDGTCGNLEIVASVAAPPKPALGKPGPGIWSWGWFWFSLTGYFAMFSLTSVMTAYAERRYRRGLRWSSRKIMLLSLAWPAVIFGIAVGFWSSFLAQLKLTPDERDEDRRKALQDKILATQGELDEANQEITRLKEGKS